MTWQQISELIIAAMLVAWVGVFVAVAWAVRRDTDAQYPSRRDEQ